MRSLKIRFSHLKLSGWVPGLSSTLRLMLGLMLGLILTQPAQAIAVKSNPEAAHGCTPPVTMAKAAAAIERFHLREISATPEETRTLGTALLWIEKLNGGKPLEDAVADAVTGYTYHFVQGVGHSQQLGHGIIIRRNGEKNYGQNVAQLVHELGHFLGNNGAYADYRKATKGQFCNVSTYSLANPNEQFAEAFATFVTYPELMRSINTPACHRAYAYFRDELFEKGELADNCVAHVNTNGDADGPPALLFRHNNY